MRERLRKVSLMGLVVLVGVIGSVPPSALAQPSPDISTKLHFRLLELLTRELPLAPQDKGLVRIDDQSRVQVYIKAEPATQSLLDKIVALGGKVDGQGLGVIQAWIPVQALESLAALPEVRYIRPPDYGNLNVGSVTTQGDAILNANAVRQQFGVDGTGIRVGVISGGLKGLGQSIASGNLPPTTFFCQDASAVVTQRSSDCLAGEKLTKTTGGITATPFPSDADLALNAEGTAMLEIVHDLAPGAELWFAGSFPPTPLDFFNEVTFLAARVDVLVTDVGFFFYFPNGQSTLTQAVALALANPSNRLRGFVQSTANWADKHYAGLYTSSGLGDSLGPYHLFASNDQTTGPSNPAPFNRFFVAAGTSGVVILSWNDPAGNLTNSYLIVPLDCANPGTPGSTNPTPAGFPEPFDLQPFGPFPSDRTLCYAIRNVGNHALPRTLNVIVTGIVNTPNGCGFNSAVHQFNTRSMSLVPPADAPGDAIAVGAVPQCAPNQIEVFSSLGPTFDGRSKPDVVAVDGISVAGAGGFPSTFFGTSAAAPHVAGIAALLLQLNPSLSRAQLKSVLQQGAFPLGDLNTFGAGRVDALSSANLIASTTGDVAAILPASRSVPVGVTATAFATILDLGQPAALSGATSAQANIGGIACTIALASGIPATFHYQTTNPATNQLTGTPDTPVNIAPGGFQTFVISITPTGTFPPTDVAFNFNCANAASAPVFSGLNTLLLSASTTPTPDIVALGATIGNTGIVNIPGTSGTGFFAVATVNVGANGLITASADTGAANLALNLSLCQTNPATGVCLGGGPSNTVTTQINAGQTPTFAIFVQGKGTIIPFDPANDRITVRFKDAGGVTRGATSVAVRTQ